MSEYYSQNGECAASARRVRTIKCRYGPGLLVCFIHPVVNASTAATGAILFARSTPRGCVVGTRRCCGESISGRRVLVMEKAIVAKDDLESLGENVQRSSIVLAKTINAIEAMLHQNWRRDIRSTRMLGCSDVFWPFLQLGLHGRWDDRRSRMLRRSDVSLNFLRLGLLQGSAITWQDVSRMLRSRMPKCIAHSLPFL